MTQPAFLVDRGDEYLDEVEPDDRADLYRCAGLDRAGVPVGAGTDAPFGPEDPWVAIAVRRPPDHPVGPGRSVPTSGWRPERALASSCPTPADPGGPPRTVAVGAAADLCLLGDDLERTLDDPRHAGWWPPSSAGEWSTSADATGSGGGHPGPGGRARER